MIEKIIGKPLTNARREKFCQLIAQGYNKSAAYEAAGFAVTGSYDGWRANASNLSNTPQCRKRISDLTEAAAKNAGITRAYVLTTLQEIVEDALAKRDATDKELENVPGELIKPASTYNLGAANAATKMLGDACGAFSPIHAASEADKEHQDNNDGRTKELADKFLKHLPTKEVTSESDKSKV